MGIRQRPKLNDVTGPDGLGTFDNKPVLDNISKNPSQYQTLPNRSTIEIIEVISNLLQDFQSKCKVVTTNVDTETPHYHVWFPYAWHFLEVGDTIKNITKQTVMVVSEIVTTDSQYPKNLVRILGDNPPDSSDVLRINDPRRAMLYLIPAYPDTESRPYTFTPEGNLQSTSTGSWVDSITYTILLTMPASIGGGNKMFGNGTKEPRPRTRDTRDGVTYSGMRMDNRVRFDFWTKSNSSSEKLSAWFFSFAMKYTWLIEANGADMFFWISNGMTEHVTRWRNDIVHRSSIYEYRTEYIVSEEGIDIKSIDINLFNKT